MELGLLVARRHDRLAVGEHVNIFSLARRDHIGQENHLIELFAFLLQQRADIIPLWLQSINASIDWPSAWQVTTQHVLPTRRRPDLLLEVPGEAVILVEVKLGSGAGVGQLADYARHLQTERREPLRGLVYLVKDNAAMAPAAGYATPAVPVFPATWQQLQRVLAAAAAGELADDFAQMLREEGLAVPERLAESEFRDWEAGAKVMQRLQALLDAAKPRLERLVPDRNWSGPMSASTEKIYRLFSSERIQYGVGFNPGSLWGYPAIIDVYVMNKTLSDAAERRRVARQLRAEHPDLVSWVDWGEVPRRSGDAAKVLSAQTFEGQIDQLVAFANETLEMFRQVAYLPREP